MIRNSPDGTLTVNGWEVRTYSIRHSGAAISYQNISIEPITMTSTGVTSLSLKLGYFAMRVVQL